ncbi:hypothetical protein ROA7450_03149 [Roseovarius albus]|uniref:Uncharacterized protein n=2 Tax=Roseovarius albus TaxID=1247867 RepID=A0A1X6ZTQ7_9RHOB|nr:hypothetical protein ROA7450_03149 [Roseovarius albus]
MPLEMTDENPMIPYQPPMPADALPEIVVPDAVAADDDRMWVQQTERRIRQ